MAVTIYYHQITLFAKYHPSENRNKWDINNIATRQGKNSLIPSYAG